MNTRHLLARLWRDWLILATFPLTAAIAACGQDPSFQVQQDGSLAATGQSADGQGSAKNPAESNGRSVGGGDGSCTETCDLKNAIVVYEGAKDLPAGLEDDAYVMLSLTQKQQAVSQLDILWVVDSSGSMSEEQAYLGQNFTSFITSMTAMNLDFQTAVTSTDVCQDQLPADLAERRCPTGGGGSAATRLRGSFVGVAGQKVLKKSDPNLVSKFGTYTKVGINGSGFEHGLKGAQLAVEKTLNGQNEALIRADSFLSVIVVSDEEDDGIGMWMKDGSSGKNYHEAGLTNFKYTEQDFINYANTAVGVGRYSVSTITGTLQANGSLCTSAHSKPFEAGTQYIKAAQKTGGIAVSICEPNWSVLLTKIAQDLPGQITQFTLEGSLVPETIKVQVNGIESNDWSYVEGSHAVKFNAGHVPAPGSVISATYFVKK